MSKEAIIDKILSDARLKADAIIGEAKNKADEIIADTAEACKGYIYNSKADTDKAVLDLEARAKTVAELDARKLQLSAKAQILDRIFARTLDKLKNLDKERYTALVFAMLQNAEDGDEVVISQIEKDIVTKESLEKFANEKGITLTLCDELGDFDGGIVIKSKGVDKNFTLDVETQLLKEELETQIAKEIFG